MKSNPSAYWREIASGRRRDFCAGLLLLSLWPISLLYALIQIVRAGLYRFGLLASKSLPLPVISVGNITVGGTGKTPVTAWIAGQLMQQGFRVAVLTRGYGGSMEGQTAVVTDGCSILLDAGQCGDEPYLLAGLLPGLIVMIGADRHAAGMLALQKFSPDVFLLDDGFQHMRLRRDLNILLLDAERPFGNGLTLPAGLLREPLSALLRADLVIHTRCSRRRGVQHPVAGKLNFAARHLLGQAVLLGGDAPIPLRELSDRKILAIAGIAEPEQFFDSLREHGLQPVGTIAFGDHTGYGPAQVAEIRSKIAVCAADCLVTTAKDAVKLTAYAAELGVEIRVATLDLAFDGAAQLSEYVIKSLQK